jgi:hypothetical protein
MTKSYKLLQKIYPQIKNDIRVQSKIKVNYREVLRDTLESLNSLPLFMILFSVTVLTVKNDVQNKFCYLFVQANLR